jgi:hypothetical protein
MRVWCELSLKKAKTKINFLDFYMDLVRRKTEYALSIYIIILWLYTYVKLNKFRVLFQKSDNFDASEI